jgi:outer membrane protein
MSNTKWSLPRKLALLALAVGLTATGVAQAQGAPPAPKIGVIDVERLVKGSVAGKAALEQLQKAQEAKGNELRAKQQELRDLQQKLEAGRMSLAPDKISAMEKQLEDRVAAAKHFQEDAERELQRQRDEAFAGIESRVLPIIDQVGKEQGFTFLFNKFQSGLLFVNEQTDITQLIIQRFDALPKG